MTTEEMKMVLMLEIIAPSEDYICEDGDKRTKLSEEERESIRKAYEEKKPWKEVFAGVKREDLRDKYIHLFEYIDDQEEQSS